MTLPILVVAESSARYYWELQTLFYNLTVTRNIDASNIILLTYGNETLMNQLKDVFRIQTYFYKDDRPSKNYSSSIRPYLIAKYLKQKDAATSFLYIDSDILLLQDIDFSKYESPSKFAYASTAEYVSDAFLESKGNGEDYVAYLDKYLPLSDIQHLYLHNVRVGAQWFLNNMTPAFFEEMYELCEKIFKDWYMHANFVDDYEGEKKHFTSADLWLVDMFVLLRLLVIHGYYVEEDPKMSFAWPMQEITESDQYMFLHNAGVNPLDKTEHIDLFWKGSPDWSKELPYEHDLSYVRANSYSEQYVKEMLKMKAYLEQKKRQSVT